MTEDAAVFGGLNNMVDGLANAFALDDLRFGNPLKREEFVIEDDRDITLVDLDLEHRERFTYGYHFGEGWQVEFKEMLPKPSSLAVPYACT